MLIEQVMIDKGFKRGDVVKASSEIFSYYDHLKSLESMLPTKTNAYRGRGNEYADVMIVSDMPDIYEREKGYIAFSDYPVYLTVFLHRLGLSFQDVYWTTAIKEYHSKINMRLIKDHYQYLHKEIVAINPSMIYVLGTTAISSLALKPVKIEKAIGEEWFFETPSEDIPVIPLTHPRQILKQEKSVFQEESNRIWRALKELKTIL